MTWLGPLIAGLETGLIMSFAVLALALAYRLFSFPDLTVEGSFLLGAAGFAVAVRAGFGIPLSVIAGLLLGAAAGALTGWLHARFHINRFLAGIVVVSISYTFALRLMGSSNVGLLSAATEFDRRFDTLKINDFELGKLVLLSSICAIVGVLVAFVMSSRMGLRWRVATCNASYARSLDIRVVAGTITGLALTNSLAALSGALLSIQQGFADVGLGQGVLILTLASVGVGDRLVSESRFSVPTFIIISAVVGSVAYQLIATVAISVGLNPIDLKLITAVLVLTLVVARNKPRDDPFVGT